MLDRIGIFAAVTIVPGLGWIFINDKQGQLAAWVHLALWLIVFVVTAVAVEGDNLGRWKRPVNVALVVLLLFVLALPSFYPVW